MHLRLFWEVPFAVLEIRNRTISVHKSQVIIQSDAAQSTGSGDFELFVDARK